MFYTVKCLSFSIIFALLLVLPQIEWLFDVQLAGVGGPLTILGQGAAYLDVFFHEIGHSVFGWLFGYPSVPTFDFIHGGGLAYQFGYYPATVYLLYALTIGYAGLMLREGERTLPLLMIGGIIIHAPLFFFDYGEAVILFMGMGSSILVGGFFLYRALFNIDVSNRASERYLNGTLGFFIIFKHIAQMSALIFDEGYRAVYAVQKGGHFMGDLDRIAIDHFGVNTSVIAWSIMGLTLIAFITPFILFMIYRPDLYDENFSR